MPKKLTIDYVKNYIQEISNSECELLSKEYINCDSLLDIKCKCGKIFHKDFHHIKRSRTTQLQCEDCLKKELSLKNRAYIEDVIDYINSHECKYISGEYINETSILKLQCKCGNFFDKSFVKFKQGQNRCQNCGAKSSAQSKIKYTADYVQLVVNKERGYNIDKSQYITSNKSVPCICSRGHLFSLRFDWYLQGKSGCRECHDENQRGINHPGWLGGENEVIDNIRKSIKDWKLEVMAYYGFKCAITGEYEEDLAIHHLKAFSTIISETSNKLKIPVLRKIKDYKNIEDFYKLKKEVINAHKVSNGIVLKRDIHNTFHDIYGRGENTIEQFDEFLKEYYHITLDQIQKNNKSNLYIPRAS